MIRIKIRVFSKLENSSVVRIGIWKSKLQTISNSTWKSDDDDCPPEGGVSGGGGRRGGRSKKGRHG